MASSSRDTDTRGDGGMYLDHSHSRTGSLPEIGTSGYAQSKHSKPRSRPGSRSAFCKQGMTESEAMCFSGELFRQLEQTESCTLGSSRSASSSSLSMPNSTNTTYTSATESLSNTEHDKVAALEPSFPPPPPPPLALGIGIGIGIETQRPNLLSRDRIYVSHKYTASLEIQSCNMLHLPRHNGTGDLFNSDLTDINLCLEDDYNDEELQTPAQEPWIKRIFKRKHRPREPAV